MKKIISALAALCVTLTGAISAAATVPRIPEYENYIFIANGGFFRIDTQKGEARRMLDVTPRDMCIIGNRMYLVAEREITDEGGNPKWIDTLCCFKMDGTDAIVLSGENDVDRFRIQDKNYYYTTYDEAAGTGFVASSVSGLTPVEGRVMDVDLDNGVIFSELISEDGGEHREIILTDLETGEEKTRLTEDFDYPNYIYNTFTGGYLYGKTYYGSTARLYRRTADAPERELILEDFLDYSLSDDGRYVYYRTQDGSSVSVSRLDTVTKDVTPILTGADYVYTGNDRVYAFRENKCETYSFDGELLTSSEIHMATENRLELTIGDINMKINGIYRTVDQPPVLRNDRTMVPLRTVIEGLGGTVEWDEAAQAVTAVKGSDSVTVTIDSDTALVNGEAVTLDAVPFLENGRTMLPLRFVTEQLGCDVDWNEAAQTITIVSPI